MLSFFPKNDVFVFSDISFKYSFVILIRGTPDGVLMTTRFHIKLLQILSGLKPFENLKPDYYFTHCHKLFLLVN